MDRQAIERLYREYGPTVYRRACNILRSEDDAREAMQDVFVTALTKGNTFQGTSTVMTWLYSVTTHLCLNRIRYGKRRAELMQGFDPESWTTATPHPELVQTIHSVLMSVPEKLAEVAVYYYLDDMTHDEIAKIMGCSRRKVGYLLDKFREQVTKKEDSE
ncbi:MAG: hypothetical protein A2289_16810 [Deltaproteobacteria bacterium RIFOXYA12_FULL_58_15]|nr:MAG: hypothetical protein A2289_16810 [Deltaproteobacteria bacterium RIFOXYA12_FULL_58_15]